MADAEVSGPSTDRRRPNRPLSGKRGKVQNADAAADASVGEHDANQPNDRRRLDDTIGPRIDGVRRSLEHNEKRSTTSGIFALVFAACGSALIISRVADGNASATVLRPATMIILCIGGAIAIAVVEAGASLFRDNYDPKGGQWDWLNIVAISLAVLGGALGISHWMSPGSVREFRFGHSSIGTACASAALGFLMIALYYNGKTHRNEQDIADLQFEADLLRHEVRPFQTRAEKLLSVNQIQLRRYYELNLQQARAVFVVGITCIVAGIAVVGLTFWLVRWVSHQPLADNVKLYTELVVAVVGAAGTLLTNYVAHMYLKLHGSITTSLMTFHSQLASTHDLFFANVLASSIEDDKDRKDVLLKLSLAIAGRSLARIATDPKDATTKKKSAA